MELNEFKELYNSSIHQAAPVDENIMEIMRAKSSGPLVQLQKKLNYMLYLYPCAVILMLAVYIPALGAAEVVHNVPLCLLLLVFFGEFLVSLVNFYTVKRINQYTGDVKSNLERKLKLIVRRFNWYFAFYIVSFLMMPLYLELSGPHGLAKINVFIRLAWYVVVFGCLFKIKYEGQKQQYQQYLDQLNVLVSQMQ